MLRREKDKTGVMLLMVEEENVVEGRDKSGAMLLRREMLLKGEKDVPGSASRILIGTKAPISTMRLVRVTFSDASSHFCVGLICIIIL